MVVLIESYKMSNKCKFGGLRLPELWARIICTDWWSTFRRNLWIHSSTRSFFLYSIYFFENYHDWQIYSIAIFQFNGQYPLYSLMFSVSIPNGHVQCIKSVFTFTKIFGFRLVSGWRNTCLRQLVVPLRAVKMNMICLHYQISWTIQKTRWKYKLRQPCCR